MSVIFLFIDGVGLGSSSDDNPFSCERYESFIYMAGGQPFSKEAEPVIRDDHLFKMIDAGLGKEGLPQSGTGQATLFTGVNAAEVVGKHFGPFPHSNTHQLLKEESIFRKAQQKGKSCYFLNAYPEEFFQSARSRNRWTCTTMMSKGAGLRLNTIEDIKKGKAIAAEITQEAWRKKLDKDVAHITPESAAQRLIAITTQKDLLLFEYFLTDKAGHEMDREWAKEILGRFDRFLHHIIEEKNPEDTLVLTSDHGNIEDLSVKTHTENKVPLFVLGPNTTSFQEVESLVGVTDAILETL